MIQQKINAYDSLTKFFHWVSAFLVIISFFLGHWMVDLGFYHRWYEDSHWWHISIGLLLALLLPLRFSWHIFKQNCPTLISHSKKQQILIDLVHSLLYLLMLVICISGFVLASVNDETILFFGWFEIPPIFFDEFELIELISPLIHQYATYILIFLVFFHAMSAIKHHFFNKDMVLKQMLPW